MTRSIISGAAADDPLSISGSGPHYTAREAIGLVCDVIDAGRRPEDERISLTRSAPFLFSPFR